MKSLNCDSLKSRNNLNALFFFKLKRGDPEYSHNQTKAKLNNKFSAGYTVHTHGSLNSKGLDFSDFATCSEYSLTFRLRLSPSTVLHHVYCPCWPSHDTLIFNMPGSLLQMGCTLSNNLSPFLFNYFYLATWHQVFTSLHNPFNPGDSTVAEAASFSVASTGLSRTLSCLQNQYHLANSYTSLSSSASTRDSLGTL